MAFALNPNLPNGLLSHLIVADIAPIRGRLSNEFTNYIEGMLKVEAERLAKSKKEAFEALKEYEPVCMRFCLSSSALQLTAITLRTS